MKMSIRNLALAASLAAGLGAADHAAAQKVVNVGIVSDPVTLDPALMASFFEILVQYNIHEPLLHLTPDLKVEPGLASVELADDLTYKFTLKPGLTFHDGTAIDAAAAKANFDRMLDPATGSPRRGELGPIDGVEVTGPLTFTVKFKAPYAPFLQVLTNRAGMMVSPSALKSLGADFATKGVGAGPFRVVSWTKNSELVLEKFAGYRNAAAVSIDRVVFRPIADETVRLTNLRSGTLQLIDGVPPQSVAQLGREPNVTVKQQSGLGFNAHSFNTTRPPFNDVRVRRAFAATIDPEVLQRVVYFNTGSPSWGAIPPAMGWVHDKNFKPTKLDRDLARKLLAEAGHTAPVPVTITVTNSPLQVRIAEVLQSQANQAGFKVEIKQIDATSLITVLRQKDFDLCMSPWSGRSDPDGNMFNYFTKNGPNNFAGWQSDKATDLLTRARSVTKLEDRAKLYREIEAEIAAELPMLFLHFDATIQASSSKLDWVQYADGALRLHLAKLN